MNFFIGGYSISPRVFYPQPFLIYVGRLQYFISYGFWYTQSHFYLKLPSSRQP
nr:MAG TPA: hypothetical protein [Crassvirales sp.]